MSVDSDFLEGVLSEMHPELQRSVINELIESNIHLGYTKALEKITHILNNKENNFHKCTI